MKNTGHIILGSSFGYSDAFKELAAQYAKVAFIDVSGIYHGPNLGSVYGRSYESQYLCGMVAGAMSKSGHLGFVAAHPLGLVNWTINSYVLGAQVINPKATVHAIFTGAWDDPVKERAADTAIIDQGADVLGQQIDTPTTQIVAQERGVYGTGHNRDLREFAPKATLCSSVWVWDRYFVPEADVGITARSSRTDGHGLRCGRHTVTTKQCRIHRQPLSRHSFAGCDCVKVSLASNSWRSHTCRGGGTKVRDRVEDRRLAARARYPAPAVGLSPSYRFATNGLLLRYIAGGGGR